MANERYENVLRARGFELVTTPGLLPLPALPSGWPRRTPLVGGRKTIGRATVEVVLQEARSANSVGLAATARIAAPGIAGEGQLRPKPLWSVYRSLASGPKVLVFLLAFFMLAGVWVVMLPGVLLFWFLGLRALAARGLVLRPELAAPGLGTRYRTWSRDPDRGRRALTPALQSAVGGGGWWGVCEVGDGAILLDGSFGYAREDLFTQLIDTAEKAAEPVSR